MTTAPKTYRRTRTIYVVGDAAFVANPATCKAVIGQLCVPSFGFCRGSTHGARRRLLPRGEAVATKVVAQEETSP